LISKTSKLLKVNTNKTMSVSKNSTDKIPKDLNYKIGNYKKNKAYKYNTCEPDLQNFNSREVKIIH